MRRALILLGFWACVDSAHAQAPVQVVGNVLSQKIVGSFDVVVLEKTPRTVPLVIREGQPLVFATEKLERSSRGLSGILWLLFGGQNLVVELQKRGLDDTRRIELGDIDRLNIRYGTSPSIVIDFESNVLVRMDVEHEGELWTVFWDTPGSQKNIRVLRNLAPFAMISER